ncbi:hypothetical protein NDA13_005639 [Ustilago tritici]|nr:hypothetical protein NDA13_005639 [Ustilago tritici]
MPVQEPVDMSAAWLAHAPPPPPNTTLRKPRRSSSYEPLSAQMNETHTRGGYLPPSSHSPEPSLPRRTSVGELKDASAAAAAASSSTPPIKRARSKVTSNPPAPSAFYNYQHQHQQQQQQQQLYRQHQQTAPVSPQPPCAQIQDAMYAQQQQPAQPSSVTMAYSHSDSTSNPAYSGYTRERRDSAPVISYQTAQQPAPMNYNAQLPHSSPFAPAAGMHVYSTAQAPVSYAQSHLIPASHLQYLASHQNGVPQPQYLAMSPQQQQPWAPAPQSQPLPPQAAPNTAYYPNVARVPAAQMQQPWDQPGYVMSPAQPAAVNYATSPGAAAPPMPSNGHTFPSVQLASPPMPASNGVPPSHPAYVADHSRQSTSSSVGSIRRPLPQPTRTSSNPSAPGSPVVGPTSLTDRPSVRRNLPRPPSGSAVTISTASSLAKSDPGSPGSPLAGTTSRLPPSALNRTESVRLAAEALMSRGAPQRRPLRSALASTTFSPPMPATRLAGEMSASQSEPVATANGFPVRSVTQTSSDAATAAMGSRPRSSQSARFAPNSSTDSNWSMMSTVPSQGTQQGPKRSTPSAPARFQPSMPPAAQSNGYESARQAQTARRNEPARYEDTTQLASSLASMSVSQTTTAAQPSPATQSGAPAIPSFSIDTPEEEPEKPRRRRGSSVSRAALVPGQKIIQQTSLPSLVPTIVLPGGDDDDDGHSGPSISISGPDGDDGSSSNEPMISVTSDEDDDVRSQTSTGSRGPSISVSFSAEPSAKSQRAGTSHSPSPSPNAKTNPENGRVSASSVGSGAGCHGCRKWIAGKVVHALGTTFHPGCFICAHCSEGLEHVAFYQHEGLPYCHFDYHELFSKRCFHCRTPIVDERYITVQDEELTGQDGETAERCYHELHFFCANCGDPFLDPKAAGSVAGSDPGLMTADENGKVKHGGMEFIVHKGYPYCEGCHVNLHKPRCKGCKKPIIYDLITALGGKWHPECFTCEECRRPFEDTQFFVKDGRPYDEECYKVLLRNMI